MIPDLYPDQDETDTRIIVSELKVSDVSQYVSCPDSEVFLIALHDVAKFEITTLFDTGTENEKRLANIIELAQEYDQQ